MSDGQRFGWWEIVDEPWGFRVVRLPPSRRGLAVPLLGIAVIAGLIAVIARDHGWLLLAVVGGFGIALLAVQWPWTSATVFAATTDETHATSPRKATPIECAAVLYTPTSLEAKASLEIVTPDAVIALDDVSPFDVSSMSDALATRLDGRVPFAVGKGWKLAACGSVATLHVHGGADRAGLGLATLAGMPALAKTFHGVPAANALFATVIGLVVVSSMILQSPARVRFVWSGPLRSWWRRDMVIVLDQAIEAAARRIGPLELWWDLRVGGQGRGRRLGLRFEEATAREVAEAVERLRAHWNAEP